LNILIISDGEMQKSFRPISKLKEDIEKIVLKPIDILSFSMKGISYNNKILTKLTTANYINLFLQDIIARNKYKIIIISLELKHWKIFFKDKFNIIKVVYDVNPDSILYIYGAISIMNKISYSYNENNLVFEPRRGVAKISLNFKKKILDRIKVIK